jgi:hypothetical protein
MCRGLNQIIIDVGINFQHLSVPANIDPELQSMMIRCWCKEPASRCLSIYIYIIFSMSCSHGLSPKNFGIQHSWLDPDHFLECQGENARFGGRDNIRPVIGCIATRKITCLFPSNMQNTCQYSVFCNMQNTCQYLTTASASFSVFPT